MRSLAFLLILTTVATGAVAAAQDLSLRIIVVKTEVQALDLRARIQKGESFEELARKYSAGTSASAGGYLAHSLSRTSERSSRTASPGYNRVM